MAKHYSRGKIINCYCGHKFQAHESQLHQPSYAIEVRCPKCNGHSACVWDKHNVLDRSTKDVFQEAVDILGFLPLYDYEHWPITFSSNIHKGKSAEEGCYDLVRDVIKDIDF